MLQRLKRKRICAKAFGRLSFSLVSLLLLLSALASAQEIETQVDEYIDAHLKNGSFNGSILIAQHGTILLSKGYGMANIELDVPNSPDTKFRLGSVTKQFTAMAIIQLQEKGLLSVTDPLSKYIPDYPDGKKITLHHLLTHTSGIPDLAGLPELQKIKTLESPVEKTIGLFKNKPLEFEPGEKYQYSNSGYILLGYIIEKITGKSYEAYLKENIFDPLEMHNTGYDHHSTIIKNRAAGYAWGKDGLKNADYIDMSIPHAGGALFSTVKDLYTWDRALYTEKLVNKISLKQIFTPFKNNYGYGWRIEKVLDRNCVRHGGGIEGFRAEITRFVDDDACIIVLSNFEHAAVPEISKDLAAILFKEDYTLPNAQNSVKIAPEILDSYVGTYEFEPENVLNVTKQENRLFIAPPGQPEVEIFPLASAKFHVKAFDAEITFIRNESGEVAELIFHVGGRDMSAKKIK